MLVEPSRAPFGVGHRRGLDRALPRADPTDAAHSLLAAQDLLFDQQHFLAVIVDDQPWRAVAKRLVQVIVPQGGHVKVSDLAVILPPDLPAQFLRTEVIADRQSRRCGSLSLTPTSGTRLPPRCNSFGGSGSIQVNISL